ncbi:MAG: CRTAC1 family protein [Planctomycetes bacterium]|nr:CRTAC1 family protein [Planctomycetota bacterium]
MSTNGMGWGLFVSITGISLFAAVPLFAGPVVVFEDITDTAGIALTDVLTESVCWGDYDNDGDPDLYLTNQNVANSLFKNEGGGVFTDVTSEAGVGNALWGVGCAFGDLDNDGDLDLYVVNFGMGTDVLYENDGDVGPGGAYVFTDITLSAETTIETSTRGVAFLDFDGDGLLDIYVNASGEDILYRNLGNLRFRDDAAVVGVVGNIGNGVGVVATDLDNDGWIDIFTGNRSFELNRLYMNDGGTFTDVTVAVGIDRIGFGMGVLSLDYDNDLDFDLYWTSWPNEPNALYENVNGDATSFPNVAAASQTLDPLGWGISCNVGDVDNDGWEDFFVTNGFDPNSSANVLFRNNQDGTFADVTAALGGAAFDGRGVAFADIDGDGDLDLCVTADAGEPNKLWENVTNNGHHWVTFDLEGTISNRSAIGARIEVTTDLMTVVKEVSSGAGRGSFNDLPLEFGLGDATTIEQVVIRWPSRIVTTLDDVVMDQVRTVVEQSPIIPATSLWGLVALALAVLASSTIILRRQRRVSP